MADGLYESPELYDLIAPPDADMEAFYVATVGGTGRTALDLGCGTGRLTLPLARSGAVVSGGDMSPQMLAHASTAANSEGLAIDLVELDMRAFELGRQFDSIMIAANSLLHLYSDMDFKGFFGCVRSHLAPGGQLVFDVFVPSAMLLSRPPDIRQVLTTVDHPDRGRVRIEETIRYDPIAQVSHIDLYWSTPDAPDFRHTKFSMRQIYPQELPLLLGRHGFRMVERFGAFDRHPLDAGSMRQVVIAAPR